MSSVARWQTQNRLTGLTKWLMVFSLFVCIQSTAFAHDGDDKRPLEHEDYDRWNTIGTQSISNDGKWISYSVVNGKDESTLKIRSATSDREYSVAFGTGGRISYDSKYAAYRIQPDPELVKKLKKEKKKPSEMPKSKFEILHLESGRHWTMTGVSSFSTPRENGKWIAYLLEAAKEDKTLKKNTSEVSESYEVTGEGLKRASKESASEKKPEEKAKEKSKGKSKEKPSAKKEKPDEKKKPDSKGKGKKKEKAAGTTLVLHNLETHLERRFPNVSSFSFSKDGSMLAMATSTKDEPESDGVTVIDLEADEMKQIINGLGNYKNLAFNDDGSQLAFLTNRDDYEPKDSSWAMYHWKKKQKTAKKIAVEGDKGIPEGWWLSPSTTASFAENGSRLYFNTMPKPEDANKEEDEDKEPVVKLDIWHWQDPQLQPQQLLQAQQERRRSFRAAFDLSTKKIAQLAGKEIPNVSIDPRSKSEVALAVTNEKYKKRLSWDISGYRDVYLVDIKTGEKKLLIEKLRGNAQISPDGKFIVYWDTESQHWLSLIHI